jgi:uncharacterized DUF497 family protein
MEEGFEWDPDKAAQNAIDHNVTFAQAAMACRDLFAVEWIDDRELYEEERWNLLGMYRDRLLFVTYTERGGNIRIISARQAERYEYDDYYRQNAR